MLSKKDKFNMAVTAIGSAPHPAEFGTFVERGRKNWATVVTQANIRID